MTLPPYKTKMVEPIRVLTRDERIRKIRTAGYNLFFLNAKDVTIDLLTDSGTSAMSQDQWAALMRGDESYAGSASFRRLQQAIQKILGFPHVIPTHQGRGAEAVFTRAFLKDGDIVIGNAPFDTTRAHIENRGGSVIDATCRKARDPKSVFEFKGNIDLKKFEKTIKRHQKKISCAFLTITCNSVGGQPMSLANIQAISKIAKKYRIQLFYDIARFAENAFFIKEREERYRNWAIADIVSEVMKYADGVLMSAKKDAIVNIGGFIALRNEKLYQKLAPYAILHEGFLHYGGMSGRDMEAVAQGLHEGIDENYLRYRIGQTAYLGNALHKLGIPVLRPFGGHAIFVDAGAFLPHVPWGKFPGHALAIALYIEGGIRSVEIGSLMFGRDPNTKENRRAPKEFLRLAVPRRVYSQEHLNYVIETFANVLSRKNQIHGVKFKYEAPILRHFSSTFLLT